ncbi:multiple sugar transport system substrate-binding protein [Lachnospiraceae bacterium NK3A20]|nr:multiple sugar transport system substrate-binding protein [Lachnospiraceae bacterium NK3A20]
MKVKNHGLFILTLAIMSGLTACGAAPADTPEQSAQSGQTEPDGETQSQPADVNESAEAALPIMGDVIQYDPNQPVNDGNDIDIEFWYWTGAANLFQSLADQYQAVHPNVHITLVENPYDDYWTKLPLALQGTDGPAIFNVHNSQHDNLIGYLAPYDIPAEDLEAEFVGASGHEIDGKIYYTDYGLMTATMYYNVDMWEAAGLTEADIPKTWDEFREVAKKLTIRDENGHLVQAGFSYNGGIQGDVLGMQYQYGQNLFTEDNKVTLNNDAMKSVIQRLQDMYHIDGVCDYNFGNNSGDNFGQGTVAMYLGWGFMTNVLEQNFPETHFACFEIPTPTADVPYAYHRYNGESTFGVNKNAPADQQTVAQDIIRFFLANDEIQKEFCLANAVFPAKTSLQNDNDLLAIPSISVLADHIDRYIWPGTIPSTVEDNVKIMLEDVFYNGKDITAALSDAEQTINEDLANLDFTSQEPMYKYASEALQ